MSKSNTDMLRPSQNRRFKTKTEQSRNRQDTTRMNLEQMIVICVSESTSLVKLKGWVKLSNSCIFLLSFKYLVHNNNYATPGPACLVFEKPPPGLCVQDEDKAEAKDCQGRDEVKHVSRTRPVSQTTRTQNPTFGWNLLVRRHNKSKDDAKMSTHESSLS